MELSLVCRLDDNQPFYEKALKEHSKSQAARLIAMLHLLKSEGNSLARALSLKFQNIDSIANLIFQFREIDALTYALNLAYAQSNPKKINSLLNQLFLLIAPITLDFETITLNGRLEDIVKGQIVHSPLLASTVITNQDMRVVDLIKNIQEYNMGGKRDNCLDFRTDQFTHGGIRVTVATQQPSAAGEEFQMIESGVLPEVSSQQWICQLLNTLALLDIDLSASMAQLMKLYTVVPQVSSIRQAGSVSSVSGWAWQDIDTKEDPQKELCHLCVQMVHEFFHTKLYLVESNIPLYQGDGNSPELFSPWKGRNRPLRQVIHALMTFSAGAAIWVKLLDSSIVDSNKVLVLGEEYCRENLEFAKTAHKTLLDSNALTKDGIVLVSACFENLRHVTKQLT